MASIIIAVRVSFLVHDYYDYDDEYHRSPSLDSDDIDIDNNNNSTCFASPSLSLSCV